MTMSHDAAPLNRVSQNAFAPVSSHRVPDGRPQALKQCVEETMQQYFNQLDGQPVTNIYDMVLSEVEAPLLAVVMRVCQGNQCRAAEMMGLSRGTLRKKLQQHGML
jgi:Fis family transcriptional regulator